jgi:hypothetical protein
MADLSSSDLVQRCRDLLGDHPYETTSTTTTTNATVAVVDGTRWEEGAIGEWQTGTVGYEQFYVQSVSVNNLVTVRGYGGTTAETHTSGDRVFRVESGFKGREIQQAVNQAVLDLWPHAWITGSVSLTWAATTKWFNLNAASLGIVSVMQLYGSSPTQVGIFRDRYYGGGKTYVVRRGLPTALVASTNGMAFPQGVYDTSNALTVTDMRAVTGTTDIKDSSNLPVAEAVTYGAVGRLLKSREIARSIYGQTQTVAGTVGTGARLQAGAWYETEFRRRLETIALRLHQLYNPDQVWS